MGQGLKAIATVYGGQRFRSRLEATWAKFFDLIHWRWVYEPIDLEGWIPDFSILFGTPLLVEVKPELSIQGLEKYCAEIEASGWAGEVLIVGAMPLPNDEDIVLGLLGERDEAGSWEWAPAMTGWRELAGPCLWHSEMSYRCRAHPNRVETESKDDRCWKKGTEWDPIAYWRQAQNETQWRKK